MDDEAERLVFSERQKYFRLRAKQFGNRVLNRFIFQIGTCQANKAASNREYLKSRQFDKRPVRSIRSNRSDNLTIFRASMAATSSRTGKLKRLVVKFVFHRPQKIARFVFANFDVGIARDAEQVAFAAFSYSEKDDSTLAAISSSK